MKPTLLALAGSTRRGSFNGRLLDAAVAMAETLGAVVDRVDLSADPLPLFDQDLEAASGLPESARALKVRFGAAQGFLFASPEYNSSLTPLMKNVIDWMSRSESEQEDPCAVYQGKVAAVMAASPGGLGGLRGLVHLRAILGNIGVLVIPSQVAVASAFKVLPEAGGIPDPGTEGRVRTVVTELVETVRQLHPDPDR